MSLVKSGFCSAHTLIEPQASIPSSAACCYRVIRVGSRVQGAVVLSVPAAP